MKPCTTCDEVKDNTEFYKDKSRKDGLTLWCRVCVLLSSRSWKARNKERRAATHKIWYASNKDKAIARSLAWTKSNPDRYSAHRKRYHQRVKENPAQYLKVLLRAVVKDGIRRGYGKKNTKTEAVLGCTFVEAREHLELTYELRYGEAYTGQDVEIDHCVPISWATTEQETYELSKINNLQYLTKEDNLRKSNKFSHTTYPERLTK